MKLGFPVVVAAAVDERHERHAQARTCLAAADHAAVPVSQAPPPGSSQRPATPRNELAVLAVHGQSNTPALWLAREQACATERPLMGSSLSGQALGNEHERTSKLGRQLLCPRQTAQQRDNGVVAILHAEWLVNEREVDKVALTVPFCTSESSNCWKRCLSVCALSVWFWMASFSASLQQGTVRRSSTDTQTRSPSNIDPHAFLGCVRKPMVEAVDVVEHEILGNPEVLARLLQRAG